MANQIEEQRQGKQGPGEFRLKRGIQTTIRESRWGIRMVGYIMKKLPSKNESRIKLVIKKGQIDAFSGSLM
jgi:hypothetical protein